MQRHLPVAVVVLLAGLAGAATELRNPFRDVPPERNGWALLVEATEAVTLGPPGLTLAEPGTANWAALERHLANNRRAMAKFEQALARPELVRAPDPIGQYLGRVPAVDLERWAYLGVLKMQRARWRQMSGDAVGAAGDLDDLLTFVEHADAGGGDIEQAAGCDVMLRYALNVSRRLMGPPPAYLDPAVVDPTVCWPMPCSAPRVRDAWRRLAAHIEAVPDRMPAMRFAKAVDTVLIGAGLVGYGGKPGILGARDAAEWLASHGDGIDEREFEAARRPAWLDPPAKPSVWATGLSLDDLIGGRPARSKPREGPTTATGTELEGLRGMLNDEWIRRRLASTVIAMRLFADDHQRLPRDLTELVAAGLIAAVPTDPYSGRPLVYRPCRGVLYSIGPNRVDDGGEFPGDVTGGLVFVPRPGTAAASRHWLDRRRPLDHGDDSLF